MIATFGWLALAEAGKEMQPEFHSGVVATVGVAAVSHGIQGGQWWMPRWYFGFFVRVVLSGAQRFRPRNRQHDSTTTNRWIAAYINHRRRVPGNSTEAPREYMRPELCESPSLYSGVHTGSLLPYCILETAK